MKQYFLILFSVLLVFSCSKEEENPVTPNNKATGFMITQLNISTWSADELEAYKIRDTLVITGIKKSALPAGQSSSSITFNIGTAQVGSWAIGEKEPGFVYGVRGTYLLKYSDGTTDKIYRAYDRDYSILNITRITSSEIEAQFKMIVFNTTQTDSLIFDSGRMNIRF